MNEDTQRWIWTGPLLSGGPLHSNIGKDLGRPRSIRGSLSEFKIRSDQSDPVPEFQKARIRIWFYGRLVGSGHLDQTSF